MKKKPTRPRKNDLSRIHVPRNSAFWDTTTASPYLVFDPRTQRPQDGAILLDSGSSSSRRNSFPQSEASPPEYTPYQTALLTSAAQLHPPPYQLPSLVSSDVPPRFRRDILPLSLYPGPFLSVPSQGQTRRASDPLVYSSRFDQPLPPPPPPPPLPPPQRSNVLDLNLGPSASDLSLPLPTPAETPRGISWPEQPEPGVIVLPLFPVPYAEAEERCKAVFGSRRKGKNIWGSPTYGNSRLAICSAPQRQSRDDLSIGLKKESSKGAQPPESAVPSGSIPERSSQSIRISSQPPGNNPFNMLGISCFLTCVSNRLEPRVASPCRGLCIIRLECLGRPSDRILRAVNRYYSTGRNSPSSVESDYRHQRPLHVSLSCRCIFRQLHLDRRLPRTHRYRHSGRHPQAAHDADLGGALVYPEFRREALPHPAHD